MGSDRAGRRVISPVMIRNHSCKDSPMPSFSRLLRPAIAALAALPLALSPAPLQAQNPPEPVMCAGLMAATTSLIADNFVVLRDSGRALPQARADRVLALAKQLITAAASISPDPAKPSQIDDASRNFAGGVVRVVTGANTGRLTTMANPQLGLLLRDTRTCAGRFNKSLDFDAIEASGIFAPR